MFDELSDYLHPSTYIYKKKGKKNKREEKRRNFRMDNTSMCHLNQVLKVKISKQVMRQIKMVCHYRIGWEGHGITSLLNLPKILNLN